MAETKYFSGIDDFKDGWDDDEEGTRPEISQIAVNPADREPLSPFPYNPLASIENAGRMVKNEAEISEETRARILKTAMREIYGVEVDNEGNITEIQIEPEARITLVEIPGSLSQDSTTIQAEQLDWDEIFEHKKNIQLEGPEQFGQETTIQLDLGEETASNSVSPKGAFTTQTRTQKISSPPPSFIEKSTDEPLLLRRTLRDVSSKYSEISPEALDRHPSRGKGGSGTYLTTAGIAAAKEQSGKTDRNGTK